MTKGILIAGFGGQGALFVGKILADLSKARNFHGFLHTALK